MNVSTKPPTAAQRNHRLVTRQVAPTFYRYDPETEREEYDTAERDVLRQLGKAVIDTDRTLEEVRYKGRWDTDLWRLFRRVEELQRAADVVYKWHIGAPIPREEDQ